MLSNFNMSVEYEWKNKNKFSDDISYNIKEKVIFDKWKEKYYSFSFLMLFTFPQRIQKLKKNVHKTYALDLGGMQIGSNSIGS